MNKPSYLSASVHYRSNPKHGSAVMFGRDTLEETLKELDYYLNYYGNELGHEIIDYNVKLYCSTCNASGEVKKGKRGFMYKLCPVCKGKPEFETLLSWESWRKARGL